MFGGKKKDYMVAFLEGRKKNYERCRYSQRFLPIFCEKRKKNDD